MNRTLEIANFKKFKVAQLLASDYCFYMNKRLEVSIDILTNKVRYFMVGIYPVSVTEEFDTLEPAIKAYNEFPEHERSTK